MSALKAQLHTPGKPLIPQSWGELPAESAEMKALKEGNQLLKDDNTVLREEIKTLIDANAKLKGLNEALTECFRLRSSMSS